MKKAFTLLTFLGVFATVYSQNISIKDSIQIVKKVEDWNQAWKIKDASLAAKWYSSDADFTNAFGFSMIGKTAIEKYLKRVFKMDFVMAGNSTQTSFKLKYISPNSILVVSTISREGQKLNDNSEIGPRSTTHHRIFSKNGDWKIIAHLISDARSIETNRH
jgi:uncharacterized protein (TIGR02246 family)